MAEINNPYDLTAIMLTTSRLLLRSIQLSDECRLFPEINSELTRHWIGWEPPNSYEDLRAQISSSLLSSHAGTHVQLVAFQKETKEFIGCCDITQTDYEDFEIGAWVKQEAQRNGYAKEMIEVLVEWAKKHTVLPYLVYSVTDGNKSQRFVDEAGLPLLRLWIAEKKGERRLVRDYYRDL